MGETRPAAGNGAKVDVLLVDDQPENLLALEAILGDLNENLVKANSGIEALRRVLEHDFAVILLDVRMPGMDGFETARLIRGRPASSHTPIIFLTAYHNTDAEILRGYSVGAVDYLLKPFEANILRTKVALFVELKKKSALIQKQSEEIIQRETEARQMAEARLRLQELALAEHKRFETELAQARDEALESTRAKSAFLANMSHEIRTPLSSIIGLTEMLRSSPLTAEQQRRLRDVRANADSLLGIISDILDFSKLSAGKISFEDVAFDLKEVFEAALTSFRVAARNKGLEMVASIEPDAPPVVRGDPLRLRQVLNNLLSNAVKFTGRGRIAVRVARLSESPAGVMLRFEVQDTGIGIAPETQTLLFKPFSQGDASTADQYGGTGLGLAIARELVERMNGSIGVVSTPGSGSTFWFTACLATVPVTAGQERRAVVAHPVPEGPQIMPPVVINSQGRPLHVLLAEDNATNREVALWQLGQMGCQVDAVVNGREALAASARTSYDVILMDCRMPEVDGYEAARQIRQREGSARRTPIVAMTAHALAGDREKCLAAGMDDYVSKPVAVEALAAALHRVIDHDVAAAPTAPPAEGAPPGAHAPTLDPATMGSLRAKRDLLPKLINTVLGDIPEQLQQIADALAAHNHGDAAIAAHSLKGTARIFGAARMAQLAAAVEQMADSEETAQAAAELDQLKQECERVSRELQEEKDHLPADVH